VTPKSKGRMKLIGSSAKKLPSPQKIDNDLTIGRIFINSLDGQDLKNFKRDKQALISKLYAVFNCHVFDNKVFLLRLL